MGALSIGTCGIPSSSYSRSVDGEPEALVEAAHPDLGAEDHRAGQRRQRRAHQRRRRTGAAGGGGGDHPPDAVPDAGLDEYPQTGGEHAGVVAAPPVHRAGLEVAAVQLGVGALLLDDEHRDAQGEDLVEVAR